MHSCSTTLHLLKAKHPKGLLLSHMQTVYKLKLPDRQIPLHLLLQSQQTTYLQVHAAGLATSQVFHNTAGLAAGTTKYMSWAYVAGEQCLEKSSPSSIVQRASGPRSNLHLSSAYAHWRGFKHASSRSASGEPGSGVTLYSHRDVRGRDMRIDSILPPVFSPKVVPLS